MPDYNKLILDLESALRTQEQMSAGYRDRILALPYMREWTEAALKEPDEVEELDVEF